MNASRTLSPFHCLLFFLFFFAAATAHAGVADSLETLLAKTGNDTNRVKLLNKLAWVLRSSDQQHALDYADSALALAEKLDFDKGRGDSYSNIGVILYRRGEYVDAAKAHLTALRIRERTNDKDGQAISCINLGNVYSDQDNNALALDEYKHAADLLMELGDELRLPIIYLNISAIYISQKNYADGIDACNEAFRRAKKNKDIAIEAQALNNIGVCYENQGKLTAALDAYLQAYSSSELAGDKTSMVDAGINVGNIFRAQGKYDEMLQWHKRTEALAHEIDYPEGLRVLYGEMSDDYKAMNDFKTALDYHTRFKNLNDSLFSQENADRISDLTNRWQNEKRERELEEKENELVKKKEELAQQKESERRKTQILWMIGSCAAALLVLSGYVLYAYTEKKRAGVLLVAQKQEIERKSKELAVKNKDITDSITYARRIQEAFLPSDDERTKLFPDHFVFLRPKDIVSGDFYWVAETGKHFFIAAADCTGHGVPGGFMSMLGTSLLNELVLEKNILSPAEILDMLRVKIIASLRQKGESGENKDGMDMVLCRFTRDMQQLDFAAANNPLWIVRNHALIEFKADKQPVGISGGAADLFSEQSTRLEKGDMLYLFSDGFADQFGGDAGKKYKHAQLKKKLIAISGQAAEQQKNLLEKEFDTWKGNLEQVDDVLVVGIRT